MIPIAPQDLPQKMEACGGNGALLAVDPLGKEAALLRLEAGVGQRHPQARTHPEITLKRMRMQARSRKAR
jgi:hypothetical protein